eukprot:GHVL01010988.1.p1 GENE.GHVL01010988.1~~GHVL01010988.1.p1  ORF type:complete len:235 (+),score=40.57 GHVL01010988.1:537-1241(+)
MEHSRAKDNYFDVTFVGTGSTEPMSASVGMNFTWTINWIKYEQMKHPKKTGQPIKSEIFNLAGVEQVQVWFYPDGMAQSFDDFLALKVVTLPGWVLPFRIHMWMDSEMGKRIDSGPVWINSAEYVKYSMNFAKIVDYEKNVTLKEHELFLGPAGNVNLGVGAYVDEDFDFDDGCWDFEEFCKDRALAGDPRGQIGEYFTRSEQYVPFKYKYIPDRHWRNHIDPNGTTQPTRVLY